MPQAARRWNFWGGVITALTLAAAVLWAFPLYWGVISSLKPDDEVVRPYIELWPETPTLENYIDALTTTQIGAWYVNSVAVAVGVTVIMRLHLDAVRLRDLAVALSGADRAVVADPRILHGADFGADHQSFRAGRRTSAC